MLLIMQREVSANYRASFPDPAFVVRRSNFHKSFEEALNSVVQHFNSCFYNGTVVDAIETIVRVPTPSVSSRSTAIISIIKHIFFVICAAFGLINWKGKRRFHRYCGLARKQEALGAQLIRLIRLAHAQLWTPNLSP